MRPGTQEEMKHCVRPENPPQDTTASKVRYALSFRALAKCKPCILKPAANVDVKPHAHLPPSEDSPTPAPQKRKICLIAGDSFAARLDAERLGKKKLLVKNIAKGGAKIKAVKAQTLSIGLAVGGRWDIDAPAIH